MKRLLSRLLPALAGLLIAGAASAQTATANLSVTASVAANCAMSTTPVAFGAYDPLDLNSALGSDLSGAGTVVVRCTKGSSYTVSFDKVSGAMTGPGGSLTYALYSDATHSTALTTFATASVPNRSAITHNIYGLVAKDQEAGVGAYADTIVATITY